jgi:anti-sigma factor RsiW
MADHDCHHLLGDLSDFVDGEASAAICAEIERHLADCENCRVVVDTLRQTIKLYHQLPQPSLPADARERLYKSLDLQAFLKPTPR